MVALNASNNLKIVLSLNKSKTTFVLHSIDEIITTGSDLESR